VTVTRAEVEHLLDLVSETPELERWAPAEELVRTADALGDDEMRFRTRLLLVESYYYTSSKYRMFSPLAFVLQRYDAGPDWLTRADRRRVLWVHKWLVTDLIGHPQVPLAQLETALDGMRRRYVAAGEGLGPVLGCAYELRAHVDGAAHAKREFRAWRRARRTHLSDCEGCEPTSRIEHFAELGRHKDAVAELWPVVHGDVSCSSQPHTAVASALASLVAVGDVESAATLHRSAYRASRRRPYETGNVARHLHFLARTGNLGRGLELLTEQLGAIDEPSSPQSGMKLAAAATRLLRAVRDAGDGDLLVHGRGRAPERVVDLLARVEEHALTTARSFDARNGTTTISDDIRRWITAPDLPAVRLGSVGTPSGRDGGPATPLDLPRVAQHPGLQAIADLEHLDVPALAALVELARRCAHVPTWDLLAAHWMTRRDAALAELDLADTALVRATADLDAFCGWNSSSPEPVLTAHAATLYRGLGDEAEAVLVELRDDLSSGRPADPTAALAIVDATGTPSQRARVRARLAVDVPDEYAAQLRAEAIDLVTAMTDPAPDDRGLAARLLLAASDVRSPGSAPGAAHADVLAMVADGEEPAVRVRVQLLRAAARAEADDLAGSLTLLDDAAATARWAGAPELVLDVESTRCRVLAAMGDEDGAESLALAVAVAAMAEGSTELAIDCRTLAVRLMAAHGREIEAIELAESTLAITHPDAAVPRELRRSRVADRAELLDLTSRLSSALDESDRAVALARDAVDLTSGPDGHVSLVGGALARLASLVEDDDAVEATGLYARALEAAVAAGQHGLALAVRRERVAARFDADGCDAALSDLDDAVRANDAARARTLTDPAAAEALSEWDFAWEELVLVVMRARVLARAGEPQRALDVLDGVPERWEALDGEGSALETQILRATLLLELDRETDGLATLAETAARARAAGATELCMSAARVGAEWLDDDGRPDEAQAFWDRYSAADSKG